MGKYLIKNFVNRNNKKYWDSLDSSKYWSWFVTSLSHNIY
jgi:hypothetical protein